RKAEWPDWHPPTEMIERQPYLPRFMAGGPGNPLGARDVSRFDRLPHPRHQPAFDDRQVRLLGLHRHAERGRLRPVRPRQGWHPRGRAARWRAARQYRKRLGRSAVLRWPGCRGGPWRTGTGATGAGSRRATDCRATAARPGDRALGPGVTNHVSKARPAARLFTFGGTPRGYAAELRWNKPNRRPGAFSGPPHSPA